MNSTEKDIYRNYMNIQFERIEKFDFKNIDGLVIRLKEEIKLTYMPSYKKYMPRDKNIQILDLGSGFGRFAYFCNKLSYKNYTGVDLSVEGIEICKKLFPYYQFIEDDFNDYLGKSGRYFDVIFLAHVLEHIKKEQISDFLEKIRTKLTDGGIVIISTPNAAAYFGAAAGRYIDFTHEISFTPESLEEILRVKSFKIIESSNIKVAVPVYKEILHKLTRIIFELFLITLGYKKEKIYTPAFFTVAKK